MRSSQPRSADTYKEDRRRLQPGLSSWFGLVFSIPNAAILRLCGLDAFFFLRFLRTVLKLFVPLAIILPAVLLPLDLVHGKASGNGVQGLDRLTWASVGLAHSSYYWAHLLLAILMVAYFCYVLYGEFVYYIQTRQEYLASLPSETTVLISGIPQRFRSREALSQLYSNIGEGVRNVWLNRDSRALDKEIEHRRVLVTRLESAQTNLIRQAVRAFAKSHNQSAKDDAARGRHLMHGQRSEWSQSLSSGGRESMRLPLFGQTWMPSIPLLGQKVDVIYHCRKEIARLNIEIERVQRRSSDFPSLDSAFVQFNRSVDAYIVCQSVAYHKPFCFSAQYVGVTPESIIWTNVGVRWWERYVRTLVVTAANIILVIGWAVPIAFTGFLSQLSYLTTLLPWLSKIKPWVFGLIQGVLPQVLLMILTSQLPNLIRMLAQHQGFSSHTAMEPAIQRCYFWFLFTQVFLTVALSSSVTNLLQNVYRGFDSVSGVLATNLPKSSNYFLSYLLLQAFSMSASELLQAGGLIQRSVLSPLLDNTPREKRLRRSFLSVVQWGTVYPVYTNLACIGRNPSFRGCQRAR